MQAVTFSIITPVYNTPSDVLSDTITSVLDQTYAAWELLLVDDASTSPAVREVLDKAAAKDSRIRVVARESNGGIVAASNDGLREANGDFVALLDHDDLLTRDALQVVSEALAEDVDYVYSDEDKVDESGRYFDHFEKPDWSPERLRHQMYTGHLSVIRTSLAREVGGFRQEFEGSQDHDLVLRVTEQARRIVHIPEVLYHWRVVPGSAAGDLEAKPYAWAAGRDAVQAHLDRVGIAGTAELGDAPGLYKIRRAANPDRMISVIIPTRGGTGLVWGERRCFVLEAVRSLLAHTSHEKLEIVVVYDIPTPQAVLDELKEIAGEKLVLVPFHGEFNFSKKCNEGFLASTGDIVVLLNDDVEAISDDVLETLVAPLEEPDVGLTGARLLFSDRTLQHAGHVYYKDVIHHSYFMWPDDAFGPFSALRLNREASGLTGACIALRREDYELIGGMAEDLPLSFNDVDFSRKLRHVGYRLVWMWEAALFHFESQTRDPRVKESEVTYLFRRWDTPDRDPYSADGAAGYVW
ncbi:glycosyltransferase family 2 protein [Sanguibacter suaedae]